MFHIEEFETKAEAMDRIALLKKLKTTWKIVRLPEEPGMKRGQYFILWTDNL